MLRRATGRVEEEQVTLETAVRSGDAKSADDARAALDGARKAQRRRLQDLTDESATALDLTSIVPVHRDTVMGLLGPDETFVSLTACGSDRYLRTRLTSAECTVDVVDAAGTFFSLLRQHNHERLSPAEREHLHERGRALVGPVPDGASLIICPDTSLVTLQWHLLDDGTGTSPLGDHVTTSVVPAAGVLAHLRRRRSRDTPHAGYLGIADRAEHMTGAASEIAYIRDRYFPRTGRTIVVDDPSDLSGHHDHLGVLHIGTHAHAGGLHFGARTITPLELAELDLTAELLLLTGCYLGAFAHDDNNEFFGIVRQLLVATGARAAVVSAEPVKPEAPVRFADLLVSALTGTSIGRPWGPVEPMAVGDAVRWARLQMRELGRTDLADPQETAYWRPARRAAWWSPWFVIGDAAAGVPTTASEP